MNMLYCSFQFFYKGHLALALAIFSTRPDILWPFVSFFILSAIGLTKVIGGEIQQEHGLDKILPFGRLFYAIPMGVFGTDHFADSKNIVRIVPRYMPWHMFWVYFVGAALIAASLSIILRKKAQLAGTLLGCMFVLFVAMMDIRSLIVTHGASLFWAITLRDFTFSGGAFAVALTEWKKTVSGDAGWLLILSRLFVGVPAIVYGVDHFLHPTMEPGFPLGKITPAWIPGNTLWVYLVGSALIICGACIVVNMKARLAAIYLGIVILLLVLYTYVPVTIANPSDIDSGLNSLADTLAFSGTALVLASAIGKRTSNVVSS
jgi:uncharacterized membrane protein